MRLAPACTAISSRATYIRERRSCGAALQETESRDETISAAGSRARLSRLADARRVRGRSDWVGGLYGGLSVELAPSSPTGSMFDSFVLVRGPPNLESSIPRGLAAKMRDPAAPFASEKRCSETCRQGESGHVKNVDFNRFVPSRNFRPLAEQKPPANRHPGWPGWPEYHAGSVLRRSAKAIGSGCLAIFCRFRSSVPP